MSDEDFKNENEEIQIPILEISADVEKANYYSSSRKT